MREHLTNVECITKIMEFSAYGALAQAFVMDALSKHADLVANADPEELKRQFGDHPLIGAEVWQAVAKEIKTRLDEHFTE